jgi:hypothetical protein
MDLQDNDALDLIEPAFLEIKGQEGQMHFIAVTAWLDIRYDAQAEGPIAEFSWEGVDEDDQRAAAAGSRPDPRGGSSDTSPSIWATIQASYASLGRFFNSLPDRRRRRPRGGVAAAARAQCHADDH